MFAIALSHAGSTCKSFWGYIPLQLVVVLISGKVHEYTCKLMSYVSCVAACSQSVSYKLGVPSPAGHRNYFAGAHSRAQCMHDLSIINYSVYEHMKRIYHIQQQADRHAEMIAAMHACLGDHGRKKLFKSYVV